MDYVLGIFRSFRANANVANLLTVLRFIFLGYSVQYFLQGLYLQAGCAYALAAVTDYLDGFYARKFNCCTEFGRYLDLIADKAMLVYIFILDFAWWVLWPTIILEGVAIMVRFRHFKTESESTLEVAEIGKWKAASQFIGIGWALLMLPGKDAVMVPSLILLFLSRALYLSRLNGYGASRIHKILENLDIVLFRIRKFAEQRIAIVCTRF